MGTAETSLPDFADSAAMAPAAWPVAMHTAWTRNPEFATRSLEMQRPAARRFRQSFAQDLFSAKG